MLTGLRGDRLGQSLFYYMDIPFDETLRRHQTEPQASEYGRAAMSGWYRERDFLPGGFEQVITKDMLLDAIMHVIEDAWPAGREHPMTTSRLMDLG
jgi:hypothetical protein